MYKYNPLTKLAKKIYRKFFPVPKSPWTKGKTNNICEINLVPQEKLTAFFKKCISDLKKEKKEEVGDYLEFGVFNGNSIGSMYKSMKETGSTFRLFGFDSFEGLPSESEKEDAGVWEKGFYSCSFQNMSDCLKKRNVDPNSINWIVGWYDKTLNSKTIEKYSLKNPGIVFIDCDTYSSSKIVLDFIYPTITDRTILCFDDWKLNDLDIKELGEYKAFNEFIKEHKDLKIKELRSYNSKSKTFLIIKK